MEENIKTRYSDEELEEFRGIINGMLDKMAVDLKEEGKLNKMGRGLV